jgi:thiamine biosynthesis lipoprotein
MNRNTVILPALLAALALGAGCADRAPRQVDFVVGTATARVAVARDNPTQLPTVQTAARRVLGTMWGEFNEQDKRSELYRINQLAGAYSIQVSFDVFRAIDLAHYYGKLTGNAYDLTVSPLLAAWGFTGDVPAEEPGEEELNALRALVGPQHLQLSEQGALSILTPGTHLAAGDLKFAYGVDLAALDLRRRELIPALVAWEDFARAMDRPAPGESWRVPVRNPFGGAPLGSVALADGAALAVAGLYDRSVTIGPRRYGGVLDPHTGRPAEGTALAAVRGPTCTMAHALAQALIVLGLERGKDILREFPECEVLLVPDRQPIELWVTPGWKDHFEPGDAHRGSLRDWEVTASPSD